MGLIVSPKSIRKSFDLKFVCLLVFIALADFLFFRHSVGWVLGGFSLLLLTFISFYNSKAIDSTFGKVCLLASLGQGLILVYDPNPLSLVLYCGGIIILTILGRGYSSFHSLIWLKAIGTFILSILLVLISQLDKFLTVRKRLKKSNKLSHLLSRWALAFVFSFIFIFFFSVANPLIGNFIQKINLTAFVPNISALRIIFWIFAAAFFAAFLKPSRFNFNIVLDNIIQKKETWLFNKTSILNALVIFNLIFLVQTVSDLMYLWGGAGLPEGMTYASYAQQGAYPLMVTALLAGLFVIITLQSQDLGQSVGFIRKLIYIWVAQNIFLVISCILRTDLYIEQYSLTYLRFSSLVWMGLVASGLCSIVVCMVRNQSYVWLINTNVILAVCVLYICSILNIGSIVADYNVRHSYELTGKGATIDLDYLHSIGVDALPALRWLKEQPNHQMHSSIEWVEKSLSSRLDENLHNWRSWTVKDYFISKNDFID